MDDNTKHREQQSEVPKSVPKSRDEADPEAALALLQNRGDLLDVNGLFLHGTPPSRLDELCRRIAEDTDRTRWGKS